MYDEKIKSDCRKAADELINVAKLKKGDILIVGCSTSEICGAKIGTDSDPDTAQSVFDGIISACTEHGVELAV